MGSGNKKKDTFHVFDEHYPLPMLNKEGKTKGQIIMEATILFAKKGYSSVSMRDLAKAIGVKPGSLYSHFDSKEALWRAVLTHTKDLYLLFFDQMDKQLKCAKTFDEVLEILFLEPKKMDNEFTCYGFSMIQMEQFNDEFAGEIFNDIFLEYSINFVKSHFDECIVKGMAPKFDTKTVAAIYMHSVLAAIAVSVQILLGRKAPYDPCEMIADLQQFILKSVYMQET